MNNKNDVPEHILKVQRASIKYSLFNKKISKYCGRRCLAALNKFHKIQQNEIERKRGTVLINIYTRDIDIYSSSEPSSNKL